MDKVITLELTVLEVMALVAMIADKTSAEDFAAVEARYGRKAAELVHENDIGYETFVKLAHKLELEGIE